MKRIHLFLVATVLVFCFSPTRAQEMHPHTRPVERQPAQDFADDMCRTTNPTHSRGCVNKSDLSVMKSVPSRGRDSYENRIRIDSN